MSGEPLSDFQEGQWWIIELDKMASSLNSTAEQKRAVSVVHNMLAAAKREAAKATGTAGEPEIRCFVQDGKAVHTLRGLEIIGGHIYEVSAARQPAPVAIKTWQERMGKSGPPITAMQAEIAELRAALAATAAPVLSDEQIDALWRERYDVSGEEWDADDFRIFARNAILAATNRSQS